MGSLTEAFKVLKIEYWSSRWYWAWVMLHFYIIPLMYRRSKSVCNVYVILLWLVLPRDHHFHDYYTQLIILFQKPMWYIYNISQQFIFDIFASKIAGEYQNLYFWCATLDLQSRKYFYFPIILGVFTTDLNTVIPDNVDLFLQTFVCLSHS